MAAKLIGGLVRVRRIGTFALRNCRPKVLLSLAVALAAVGGCRNDITRQNLDSERFLDQYAAGRGLTRDQARREVEEKVTDQEQKQATTAAESNGVIAR